MTSGKWRAAIAILVLAAGCGVAHADDTPPPSPQGDYSLFKPVPDDKLGQICSDRPTKSNNPCTVPAGHWQVETDLIDGAFQHTAGVTTDTILYASSNVKLGLTPDVDAELNITPAQTEIIHDHVGRTDDTLTGFGDMVARVKWNFLGADGGPVSIALSPFIKLPTARQGIGDGAVEEGLLIPVQINLPASFTFGFNGEIDALKNDNDTGRHANYVATVSLAHPVTKTVTGSVELWSDVNADPAGVVREYSFDLALAWIPAAMPSLQLDGGVNIGLNDATPGAQVYVGVSRRF